MLGLKAICKRSKNFNPLPLNQPTRRRHPNLWNVWLSQDLLKINESIMMTASNMSKGRVAYLGPASSYTHQVRSYRRREGPHPHSTRPRWARSTEMIMIWSRKLRLKVPSAPAWHRRWYLQPIRCVFRHPEFNRLLWRRAVWEFQQWLSIDNCRPADWPWKKDRWHPGLWRNLFTRPPLPSRARPRSTARPVIPFGFR